MAVAIPTSPYDPTPLEEQPLGNAPLVRVLAQIRHPALLSLASDAATETALRVAQSLSEGYPIFEAGRETAVIVTPEGVKEQKNSGASIWRLRDPKETWQVSFSKEFLAVETSAYEGRTHFFQQLQAVLSTYVEQVKPPSATRIGVRYTNRVAEPQHLDRLKQLVRPELLGPVGTELPGSARLLQTVSQAQFSVPNGGSLLHWGLVPPNGAFDPTLTPLESQSWILDIDAFHSEKSPFEAKAITELARRLAVQAHTHFRWAVTEDFLRTYR
ncbi:TIGR04255 family protein [Micromonospora sp. NPDC048986]|uniref:TIGR04255 family protein n=1 Tax=Micromonospora sp. NPDC048986 TaxID=3155644 RepID=UPI0033C36D66